MTPTSDETADSAVVLVVDDDEEVLETYELWLADGYDLRTAANGEEALARLDADVDVVLLDRLMPGMSGEEVLAEIRDRGIDCRVAMATAVEPDEDIAQMPFDAYVTKALERDSVRETIEALLSRADEDDIVQEHYAVAEKLATLEESKTESQLDDSEEYRRLRGRIEELDDRVTGTPLSREDLVQSIDDVTADRDGPGDGRGTGESPGGSDRYDLLHAVEGAGALSVPAGTSLLVAAPMPAGQEFIVRSLEGTIDAGDGALALTTDESATTAIDGVAGTDSADLLRVVDCASGPSDLRDESVVVQDVDTPRNLTDIGIGFTNAVSEFEELGVERGRCGLLSLSVILSYVDQETAYRFCQTLSRGLAGEGFLGLFLLDRNAHDEQTEKTLRRAFDGLVEIRASESGRELRVSGVDGVPADWVTIP